MTSPNVYSAFVFSTNNTTIVILNNYLYRNSLSLSLLLSYNSISASIFIDNSITLIDKLNQDQCDIFNETTSLPLREERSTPLENESAKRYWKKLQGWHRDESRWRTFN